MEISNQSEKNRTKYQQVQKPQSSKNHKNFRFFITFAESRFFFFICFPSICFSIPIDRAQARANSNQSLRSRKLKIFLTSFFYFFQLGIKFLHPSQKLLNSATKIKFRCKRKFHFLFEKLLL